MNELRAFNREGGAACVIEGEGSRSCTSGGGPKREFEVIEAELEAVGVEIDQF